MTETFRKVVRSSLLPVLQAVDLHEEMENFKAPNIDISISPGRIKDED